MDNNYFEVVQHINEYFRKHLAQYTPIEVRRQSYNVEDNYLYMVAGKKEDDGSYAVWMSWNDKIGSLNFGHYDLPSLEACAQVMAEYQCGSLYADENSSPLEFLYKLLIKHDDEFESTEQQLLYIKGFADGINAQQKYNWKKLNNTEINELFTKAVEV